MCPHYFQHFLGHGQRTTVQRVYLHSKQTQGCFIIYPIVQFHKQTLLPGLKEPRPACLLQADRQQQQLIPPALISSRSSSKGSLIPLTEDPKQHARAAVPSWDLGKNQLCCWTFAKHVALVVTLEEAITAAKKIQLSKSSYPLFLIIYH